jgi:hypothetical protein
MGSASMILSFKKLIPSILFFLIFIPASHSKVVVFDLVTTAQTPVHIKVLTGSGFFSAGGRLVDLYLDNVHLKKILTGGDGYGYLKYTPLEKGLKKITAYSDSGGDSGLMLVMGKGEKAILIETEGAFKNSIFSDEIMEGSQRVVNSLSENYKIIYLSRFLGKALTGNWLEKRNFPKSVILRWQGPSTLKSLTKKGVQLHAIIGSSTVISSAKKHVENRYTFEPTKNGITVKDWEEIINHLEDSSESQSDETESPVADK